MPPRDFTKQENIIAQILSEMGLRYEQQYVVGVYTVDFYISEIQYIIEADGVYGHLRKADAERDRVLQSMGIKRVIHIKETTKSAIQEALMNELECQE